MLSQVKEQMPVVETALLGHGVPSVQDDLIVALWPTVLAVKSVRTCLKKMDLPLFTRKSFSPGVVVQTYWSP